MRFFKRRNTPNYSAIKLYCIGEPANRELLLSRILNSVERSFGAIPEEFDIGGPYGMKKGNTIGYRVFQSKLAKIGHQKYYSLSGETDGKFGFSLLLGARMAELTYSELVVWYEPGSYAVDFLELVEPLLEPFNAVCGFEIGIPDGYSVNTETKIRRSLFGSISVDVNYKHLSWLPSAQEGGIRGLFKNNIVNSEQILALESKGITTTKFVANGLHYISLAN